MRLMGFPAEVTWTIDELQPGASWPFAARARWP